ncbi:MAG: cyclic nucleotide-binding protein, partial [Gemmatimonadota bacterium]
GRLPFDMQREEDEPALRSRIAAGAEPVPLRDRAEVPGGIARAVMRAIAPDPANRFATISDLAQALNAR